MTRSRFANFPFYERSRGTVPASRKEPLYLIAALTIILIYISPLFILGEDSRLLIHDNLDEKIPILRVLADEDLLFAKSDSPVEQIFNGIPRGFLSTELSITLWLFMILPPFSAFAVNLALMHLIAFAGMYRLLHLHFLPAGPQLLTIGIALTFSLLPFLPVAGLSIAGLSLALSAFLSIRTRRDTWLDWLIIILIPFYSSLIHSFAFFLVGLSFLWIYDVFILRRFGSSFLAAMGLMFGLFLIVEYRLLLNTFLESGVVSHRKEFAGAAIPFLDSFKLGIRNFLRGHYHAHSFHLYLILPTSIIALFTMWLKKIREPRLLILLVIAVAISAWYGLWSWVRATQIVQESSLLTSINLGRFHWLLPLIWYLIFALALNIIYRYFQKGRIIVLGLITLQVLFLFSQSDQLGLRQEQKLNNPEPTYKEFYAEDLFLEIANYIGKPQESYRVVSLGLHANISIYNGFYALDGYVANYPLEYKISFRPIIERELEKSNRWQEYYDNWGSRVYLFSDELDDANYIKERDGLVNHLEVNTGALKKLGGEYVFSAVEIKNADEIGLDLLKVFEQEDAAWRVHLYHLK